MADETLPIEHTGGPVEESPEFQMAVSAAVAKATAGIRDELLGQMKSIIGQPVTPAEGGAVEIANQIALAVSQMADQGSGRKRVPVEVLAAREAGRKDMEALLLAARDLPKNEKPRYRLIAAGWFKDRLVQPFTIDKRSGEQIPTEVVYMAIPGEHMKPINKSAKAIYAAYQRSISNNAGTEVPLDVKSVWVTDNGVVITGTATATARAHGRVIDPMAEFEDEAPEVTEPSLNEDPDFGIVNQYDPRAKDVHVLGTIASPAQRTTTVERAARQAREHV
jgi:hypothetical protein